MDFTGEFGQVKSSKLFLLKIRQTSILIEQGIKEMATELLSPH